MDMVQERLSSNREFNLVQVDSVELQQHSRQFYALKFSFVWLRFICGSYLAY